MGELRSGVSVAFRIGNMEPGESILIQGQRSKLSTRSKDYARKYAHDEEANWTGHMTNKGLRVKRIK